MGTVILGLGVFSVATLGLSLGVLLGRRPLQRGCTLNPAAPGEPGCDCTRDCEAGGDPAGASA